MKTLSKAIAVGAAFVLALAMGTSAAATPKDVSPLGFGACPDNWVCLWDDTSGYGDYFFIRDSELLAISCSAATPGFNLAPHNFNDRAESILNNTSFTVRFYSYAGGGDWNWISTPAEGKPSNLTTAKQNRIDLVTRCAL